MEFILSMMGLGLGSMGLWGGGGRKGHELREDGSFELREDGSYEIRE